MQTSSLASTAAIAQRNVQRGNLPLARIAFVICAGIAGFVATSETAPTHNASVRNEAHSDQLARRENRPSSKGVGATCARLTPVKSVQKSTKTQQQVDTQAPTAPAEPEPAPAESAPTVPEAVAPAAVPEAVAPAADAEAVAPAPDPASTDADAEEAPAKSAAEVHDDSAGDAPPKSGGGDQRSI